MTRITLYSRLDVYGLIHGRMLRNLKQREMYEELLQAPAQKQIAPFVEAYYLRWDDTPHREETYGLIGERLISGSEKWESFCDHAEKGHAMAVWHNKPLPASFTLRTTAVCGTMNDCLFLAFRGTCTVLPPRASTLVLPSVMAGFVELRSATTAVRWKP